MAENENNVITVSFCGKCPFMTPEIKCEQSEFVEIDADTCDDDVPAICPLMSGRAVEKDGKWVKLASWLMTKQVDNYED